MAGLGAEFVGGTAGSALGQWIRGGKVDLGKSLVDGVANAATGAIYGNQGLKNLGNALVRGAGAGAARSAINYTADGWNSRGSQTTETEQGSYKLSSWEVPYLKNTDSRMACGVRNPMEQSIGYRTVYGYQYETEKTSSQKQGRPFKLGDFFKEIALEAITEGVASAAFYGIDRAVGVLRRSPQGESGRYTIDNDLRTHIETVAPKVPRKRGIGGAHNKNVFLQNDIQVVSTTPYPQIRGVEIIEYQMPKLDAKTRMPIPGEYQTGRPKVKTVYDPNIFSTDDYLQRGIDAANNGAANYPDGLLPREWVGYDNHGVRWRGYCEDGKITSFYPE